MISSSFIVRVATAAVLPNVTFDGAVATADANGALMVDGVNMSAGDLLLVKDQVDKAQNGIFSVVDAGSGSDPFIIERYPAALGLKLGNIVFVREGNTNISRLFVVVEAIQMVGSDDTCVDFVQSSLAIGKITEDVENEGVDVCVGFFGIDANSSGLKINGVRVLRDRRPNPGFPANTASGDPAGLTDAVTKVDFNDLVSKVNLLYTALGPDSGSGHGLFDA